MSVNTPFEAADCSSLTFKPGFTVSTSGENQQSGRREPHRETHRPRRARHPGEHQPGQSRPPQSTPLPAHDAAESVHRRAVRHQPRRVPSRRRSSGTPRRSRRSCRSRWKAPRTSSATAAKRSPSLEIVLQGYGFTIDLTASTFISKAGITSSTFKTVPDQPVTSFELTLPEGPYSALTAIGNLCTATKAVTVKKKVTIKVHGRKKTITREVKKTGGGRALNPLRCRPNSSPRMAPRSTRTLRSPSPVARRHARRRGRRAQSRRPRGRKKGGK